MGALAVVKYDGNQLDQISSFPLLFFHPGSLMSGPNQSQSVVEHINVNLLWALNRVGRASNCIVLQRKQLVHLFLLGLTEVKENLPLELLFAFCSSLLEVRGLPCRTKASFFFGLTEASWMRKGSLEQTVAVVLCSPTP